MTSKKKVRDLRGVPQVAYRLDEIVRRRTALLAEEAWQADRLLDESVFEDFVRTALRHLPRVEPRQAYDSLAHLLDRHVTAEDLWQEAWRLAGNLPRLQGGYAVPPWSRQAQQEWVPMVITEYVPYSNRRREPGGIFSFQILAGSPCGWKVERFWTSRFCYVLARDLGFTKSFGAHPLHSINELVGLRLSGLIDNEKSVDKPFFDVLDVSPSMVSHNQRLIKARARIKFRCPKRYTHECRICPVGYDQCGVAMHPRTFVQIHCKTCGKRAWADPIHEELLLCYLCFTRKQLQRE